MTVKIETILQIEETLARRLVSSMRTYMVSVVKQLLVLTADGKWDEAYGVATAIDVASVLSANDKIIDVSSFAAMKFGASQLGEPTITKDSTEEVRSKANSAFATMLIKATQKSISDSLVKDLDDIKKSRIDGAFEVKKEDTILRPFQSFAEDADASLKMASQLHTSRLSSIGFTAEADIRGVARYKINEQLDIKVCPVCAEMHGKVFEVEAARESLETIIGVSDSEELKTLQQWPSQDTKSVEALKVMSANDLVKKNWHLPPYHPYCRGLLVAEFAEIPVVPLEEEPRYLTEDPSTLLESFIGTDVYTAAFDSGSKELVKEGIGDVRLAAIQDWLGYNRLPVMAYKREIDATVKAGGIEVMRGLTATDTMTAKELVAEFKSGRNYAGLGVYGNGTYTLTFKDAISRAKEAATEEEALAIQEKARVSKNVIFNTYAKGIKDGLVRGVLPVSARVIEKDKLEQLLAEDKVVMEYKYRYEPETLAKFRRITADRSWYAALKGYDAIHVASRDIMVILNRNVLQVQRGVVDIKHVKGVEL